MAEVILEKLTKVYNGGVKAVDDFTLGVQDGELMVIVGPSGCGKTTILRVIAGLEEATSGTVTIGDRIVNHIPPRDRGIAMVFQNYALYPHMTVFQNMAFGLRFRRVPKVGVDSLVLETSKTLGISDLLDRRPKALSGGQRQRVALGRAIVQKPKVFLFDEPLSNLDAKLRVETRAELKALHHRLQTTSIYVTHDQVEAMTLGDRICVMYDGVIQQVAEPLEVYDKPINRFVAGFLGTPPMNFFDGIIRFRGNNAYFIMDKQEILLADKVKKTLTNYKDSQMALGIRPKHLSMQAMKGQSQNAIDCIIKVIEPLGSRMDMYLQTERGDKFIANVDPHLKVEIDQPITIYVNTERINIFEPGDIGRNITLN